VNKTLTKAGHEWEKRQGGKMSLPQLVKKVASHLDLKTDRIISVCRRQEITEARSLISYLAINAMGYSASEVAGTLSISRVSAGRSAERGEKLLDKYDGLRGIA
jgi:chromosomal replication initiation ATPase DnaA